MKFQKGQPRPTNAGRKKGSINKLNLTARQRLAELGCDPLKGMFLIATDDKSPNELKGRMWAELAKYNYPQLKAIEHSGPGGGPIETKDVNAAAILRSRIAGIAERRGARGSSSGVQ